MWRGLMVILFAGGGWSSLLAEGVEESSVGFDIGVSAFCAGGGEAFAAFWADVEDEAAGLVVEAGVLGGWPPNLARRLFLILRAVSLVV
jgi:hypothetical protein